MGFCDDCCVLPKESREPLKHDPNFNGPIHNRSCTDIIWLIVFIAFLAVWGYVGYYSIQNGNVEELLAPIDSEGRKCGFGDVADKRYLVFFDITQCLTPTSPITGCSTPQVCVKDCPRKTIRFKEALQERPDRFEELKKEFVCKKQTPTSVAELFKYIDEGECASYVLKSESVLFRCIGDLSTLQCKDKPKPNPSGGETCVRNPKEARRSLLNSATALDSYVGWIVASWVTYFKSTGRDTHVLSSQIVQDLVQSRWYMLGALVAVVLICFLYILLLRWVVTPVVWSSIVGLLAVLGFAVYLCYKNYKYYKANPISMHQTTNLKGYTQSMFSKHQTWMVLLVVTAIILLLLIIIVIFLRKRITIAIALIREGSKAVMAVKSTIFFPIFPWLIQCAVIAYFVVVLMFIMSIGTPSFVVLNLDETKCECEGNLKNNAVCYPANFTSNCWERNTRGPCEGVTCYYAGLDNPHSVVYLHLLNLLGFFWMMFFISGISDMMLASTFSTWYWTFNKVKLPFFTLTSGITRTLRYHLGTVAFGALIIAIVRVIRVILEYIDQKVKKFDNPLTRCIMCFCKCFFWCLESFLKFINKNAYIMCAIHGNNFCKSARDAFSLLMRNIIRVVVLDKVTDFIFFLSKLLISIGVGFAVYYLLEWNFIYDVTNGERLHYNYIPAIILSIATYLISTIFFNVYSMAVDTLFLCFLEDCERNDGSAEKPYFMSRNLMKILGKNNKKVE